MRLAITLIGFLTVLTGPWWAPLGCMILLLLRWQAIGALVLGLLTDLLWQGGVIFPYLPLPWPLPVFTITAVVLLWGLEPFRRKMLT